MLNKIFLILCIFVFIISCNEKTKKKDLQHLTVNIQTEPSTLDPRKVRDLNGINISRILFEGLLRIAPDHSLECAIANSYEIFDDGKTYNFYLKNTFWSNGEKLTAYDFEYSLKKALSKDYITPNANSLFVIKNAKLAKEGKLPIDQVGVRSITDKILQIKLEKSTPYFLKLLTLPIYFPINEKVDKHHPNWTTDPKLFVSNGPYKLISWKHSDCIRFRKNRYYNDEKSVKLEKISMVMITPDAELNMYERGNLQIAGSPFSSIQVENMKKIKKNKNFNSTPYYGTNFLRINTQKIKDVNFRRALKASIDREKIVKHILQANQKKATRLIPRYDEFCDSIENFEEKKILTLSYPNGDNNHLIAQSIQRDLEENLNLTIKLQGLDKKTYFSKLANLDYEIAASSWIADFEDPINFLSVFKHKDSSTNNTGWENKNYINLLEESEKTLDKNKRDKLLYEAENILLDDSPIIPICHMTQCFLKKRNLKNVYIHSSGYIDLKYAYFE